MTKIFRSTPFWLLLALLVTFFAYKPLLRAGYFPMHDDMQAMRVHQLDKCVEDRQIPCRWVPDMGYGYGYPQFNYYPPLPYYVMEAFHLGGFSILGAVKAGFVLSFVLSVCAMFLFGKALYGNVGAFVASVFYIYAPYRATGVYNRGAVGEFWALVFLPLIFWAMFETVRKKENKYVIFLALSFAGLLTTHLITSMIFAVVALFWGLFLLWHFQKGKKIKQLTYGAVLAFMLAGFFILPVLFEKKFAHTETLTMGFFNYLAHFVSVRQLFTSTHWGFGSTELGPYDNFNFSVGLLHWALGLVSLVIAFIYRTKNKLLFHSSIVLFIITLASLFMTHQKSVMIWNSIPALEYFQFPWRFLTIAIFSVSTLVGVVFGFMNNFRTKIILASTMVIAVVFMNVFYFYPRVWYDISDADKFSGELWEKQLTISIYDYLPIFAGAPPSEKAPDSPILISGEGTVKNFQSASNWQSGEVEIDSSSATLQTPSYYFPGFVAMVDGEKVDIDYQNDLGLITYEVPEGIHSFETRLMNTPVRALGNLLTILGLIAIVVWIGKNTKHAKD